MDFLDTAGLERLWQHILAKISTKADASEVSGLQSALDSKASSDHTHPSFYGTCSTAADVLAKSVTVDNSFSLENGAKITIKFEHDNTIANPRINVNNLGSKAIFFNGSSIIPADYWKSGAVLDFFYDGTQWNMVGSSDKNVTTVTTNPSSNTTYFVPFSSAAQTGTLGVNDGYKYYTREGTTSALGYGRLWLGNATAKGTAGNKSGQIGLYNENGTYTLFSAYDTDSSESRYLVGAPTDAGIGNTNRPVYIDSTGLITAIGSVGVEYGGTGATTVENARTNLSVYSKSEVDSALASKLNKSGGTLTGMLELKPYDNGYSRLFKNHSATADYGTVLQDVDKNGNAIKLTLMAADGSLNFVDKSGNIYPVYGGHNTTTETWTFTLEDGSTVTKAVYVG